MVKKKEIYLVSEFTNFIKLCETGKRKKKNGYKLAPGTIVQYKCVQSKLIEFEACSETKIRLRTGIGNNKKLLKQEGSYLKRFEIKYTKFLRQSGSSNNYIGLHMKVLKTLLKYLAHDKGLSISPAYKNFTIYKEEKPILVLSPERVSFLINNREFHESLPAYLKRTKDILIVGCTVALRYSDLMNLKRKNLSRYNNATYLQIISQKTGSITKIRLPEYVVEIFKKGSNKKGLLPLISNHRLNSNLKELCALAGWTEPIDLQIIGKTNTRQPMYFGRFCDNVTSHIMRRTAITTMLSLGMSETAVRKISGHSANSISFHRYIQFSQAYLDSEIEVVFSKLQG